MITWDEFEAGLPGQPPLRGFTAACDRAERIFVRLAREWKNGFAALPPKATPPRRLDELAFATCLLALDHGNEFTEVISRECLSNILLVEHVPGSKIDGLPWIIIDEVRGLRHRLPEIGLYTLSCHINMPSSVIRMWAMELAWMFRAHLKPEEFLPPLFDNVARTLAGVEMSWGLAGALCKSDVELREAARRWSPEEPNWVDQYNKRVTVFNELGSSSLTQSWYWELEVKCRRIVLEKGHLRD